MDPANPNLLEPCCLCGLLCASLAGETREAAHYDSCHRRGTWLSNPPTAPPPQDLPGAVAGLDLSSDSLIWIDAADVNTTRAIVNLAKQSGATIHIGQSTGSAVMGRVMASEGWLGTSLSEVAVQADLVISIGDALLKQMPMFAPRFAQWPAQKHWYHIGDRDEPAAHAAQQVRLPRVEWYAAFTELLLALQTPNHLLPPANPLSNLLDAIRQSRYAALVWQTDDLLDDLDELVVRRFAAIARQQSLTSRFSLLCLDSSPGRVTAEETLLWLTGCGHTARYRNGKWSEPQETLGTQLGDWQQSYASIIMIRSLATQTPLPELACDLVVLPAGELQHAPKSAKRVCGVKASGIEAPGLLFRGDRAAAVLCAKSTAADVGDGFPTAESLVSQATQDLAQSSGSENAD